MALFYLLMAAAVATAAGQDLAYIDNFKQSDRGDNYIELSWDLVGGDPNFVVHKYILTTDDDFNNDVRCPLSSCTYVVDYLTPCKEHLFELVPYFTDPSGGSDLVGLEANTTGFTNDLLPGAPSNVDVVAEDDSGATLSWTAPSENPGCVDQYQVCSRLDGQTDSSCEMTSDTTITMSSLQACGLYHVTITPITPSGIEAEPLKETIETRDDIPGAPEDVVVGLITEETIQLLWNDPLLNPLCVDKYVITFGETHSYLAKNSGREAGYENEATISPLSACTNYTIDICAQNSAELSSPTVTNYAATAETEPLPPPYIELNPEDSESILVTWGDNEDDRCAGSFVICWNDGVHPVEVCQNVTGDGDNSYVITDLLPCTDYEVIINVVSPSGANYSDPTKNHTSTLDEKPGPVMDLRVTDTQIDAITITFDPPQTHPQCVKEYDINIIDEDQSKAIPHETHIVAASSTIHDTVSGLDACTNYLIRVSAVTPSGKRSDWDEVREKTLGDLPSAPQELGVSAFDKTSMTVQWFQPVENSRCVTHYDLTWSGPDSGSDTVTADLSFKMTYDIVGLTPCSNYTISVIAVSDDGSSSADTTVQDTLC